MLGRLTCLQALERAEAVAEAADRTIEEPLGIMSFEPQKYLENLSKQFHEVPISEF